MRYALYFLHGDVIAIAKLNHWTTEKLSDVIRDSIHKGHNVYTDYAITRVVAEPFTIEYHGFTYG